MGTTKKSGIRKYILALLLVLVGIAIIVKSNSQVYGVIYGITFFIMAVRSIIDTEDLIKFGST
ncbi:MAG: hypothetical protein ACM3PX_06130 [Omnitrophica WOR_2 bacterium]|jgi:hypothetical protein